MSLFPILAETHPIEQTIKKTLNNLLGAHPGVSTCKKTFCQLQTIGLYTMPRSVCWDDYQFSRLKTTRTKSMTRKMICTPNKAIERGLSAFNKSQQLYQVVINF